MISLSSTEITFITDGVVHSLAFIGRTRTATVKLLISLLLFVFPSPESSVFCDDRDGVGVSNETFEKHSGVRNAAASFKLDDEVPNKRLPIDFGVDGSVFSALDVLAALRNDIDGV